MIVENNDSNFPFSLETGQSVPNLPCKDRLTLTKLQYISANQTDIMHSLHLIALNRINTILT